MLSKRQEISVILTHNTSIVNNHLLSAMYASICHPHDVFWFVVRLKKLTPL